MKEKELQFNIQKNVFSKDSQLLDNLNLIDTKYGKYITHSVYGTTAQTATNYGIIFVVRHPIEIMRISETHAVAGSAAGAVTLNVLKAGSGVAIASGISLLSSTFNLKSTANTPVIKEGSGLTSGRVLIKGDRIGLVATGTLTGLSDLCITIYYKEILQDYIY